MPYATSAPNLHHCSNRCCSRSLHAVVRLYAPAIEKVRTETNTRIDATNADVAANAARIAATEQKSAGLEALTREHAKQIAAVDERTRMPPKLPLKPIGRRTTTWRSWRSGWTPTREPSAK